MTKNLNRDALRAFYDKDVRRRNEKKMPAWKVEARKRFAEKLIGEDKNGLLLEIGSGTGRDATFFSSMGVRVIATDVSEGMLTFSQSKGIQSLCMDALELAFNSHSIEYVYALNSLLHLSKKALPIALQEISRVLKPGGLFYYGVYGGKRFEGINDDDLTPTKRFFSYYPDEELKHLVEDFFDLVEFRPISLNLPYHFQSMTWQKRC